MKNWTSIVKGRSNTWRTVVLAARSSARTRVRLSSTRTKESFVLTASKPLVGTLMTIGDIRVSIAIA